MDGIIFAFDSLNTETIIEHLREINPEFVPYLPNMIVLYKKKTIIVRIKYYKNEDDGAEKLYPNF